jgi:glyoxylase-like metal-dependent hydrolase (beta-lactamase superfamily II)
MLKIEKLPGKINDINCYVVSDNTYCIIFDPGCDHETISSFIASENVEPKAIFLTNCYYDHIGSLDILRGKYKIPVYVNPLEKDWLLLPERNGSTNSPVVCKPADCDLEMKTYQFGRINFKAIATPGNTVGGTSFIFENFVLTGDTLLKSNIGKTDLATSNLPLLLESVTEKIFQLSDNVVVYPARGDETTIRTEKSVNQFFYHGLSS